MLIISGFSSIIVDSNISFGKSYILPTSVLFKHELVGAFGYNFCKIPIFLNHWLLVISYVLDFMLLEPKECINLNLIGH